MATLPPPWLGIAAAASTAPSKVTIEMVADVVCPYCHIGLNRLTRALEASGTYAAMVDVRYTPFILRRHLPKEGVAKRDVFEQQFGDPSRGDRMLAQVVDTAAEDGLNFDLTGQRAGNSEDAHRLLLWADSVDRNSTLTLFESMVRAYNQERGWLGDHTILRRAVERSGLSVSAADTVLAEPSAFATELEAGLERARALGVTGVPAFFVNGQLLGTGALSEGALRSVIEHTCAALEQ